jgi:hypothetical protein
LFEKNPPNEGKIGMYFSAKLSSAENCTNLYHKYKFYLAPSAMFLAKKFKIPQIYRVTEARCWWRSWLRHCPTSWKVAGSIPDGVTGFFH